MDQMSKLPPFSVTPALPQSARWDDLRAVAAVVQAGTLAGAGQRLGVNYTTVARRIARAEAALGVALFERLADGYVATGDAHLVASHVQRMADSEHAMMRKLSGRDGRLSGELIITAPQLLVAHVLAPFLRDFREMHPDLDLRVRATNDRLDQTRREADIGIRIRPDPGDTLMGVRLTEQHTASFTTQAWADRIADEPNGPIDWVLYDGHDKLPKSVAEAFPGSRIRYRFDDMIAMAGAAQAGLGVVRMPMFLGRAVPGLVQVPLMTPQPYPAVWVVAHADVWKGAKVRVFREMLIAYMRRERHRFVA